jgi:hypothetical protein
MRGLYLGFKVLDKVALPFYLAGARASLSHQRLILSSNGKIFIARRQTFVIDLC